MTQWADRWLAICLVGAAACIVAEIAIQPVKWHDFALPVLAVAMATRAVVRRG